MHIETRNLMKTYTGRQVVNDVSIEVAQGSVVGLLGPNGAGKTTTFYMIVGVERPDGGSVLIDGRDITKMPMNERAKAGIGYLPQEASIFRKLTVEDNIMAILELTGLNPEQRVSKMNDLIAEFHVEHIRHRKG
ncbi:MAG: ATP-binding cassette domain-containing protein, partial [Acidaminococcaceae bacterium]